MRYTQVGKAKEKLSVLTVGTWVMGGDGWGDVDRQESIRAIHAMVENGVNFIDTAPIYGYGHAEEVVAEAISTMDRSKLFISTKFGSTWPNGKPQVVPVRNNSRENIFREIDDSLARLGTDYVDLYICHQPDAKQQSATFEETMTALEDLRKTGKIRYIGLSNYNEQQMQECVKYGKVDWLQTFYCMIGRQRLPAIQWAAEHDIAVMTFGSLGSGILTGAFREKPTFDEGDRRAVSPTYSYIYQEPNFSKTMQLLQTLDAIALAHGVPVAQVSLNWVTQNPMISTALVGVRNVAEANENCASTLWTLSDEEMATINKAIENTFGK